jgi:ABC-2 type transport system ATP-binding protein
MGSAEELTPAVELRGFTKRYGERSVVNAVDLVVQRGQIVGYLGRNGAGKSTTIKALMGFLDAWEGEVRVLGLDPRTQAKEIKARVGYVPENAALYEQLTVAEHLLLVARLFALDATVARTRAESLLAGFDLLDRVDARIGSLSKGMRQKLLITSALLHAPQVLFLDEPLSGLDAHAAVLVKKLLRALADQGWTIFYSSHALDVVQQVCDRIIILDEGKVVAAGTYDELARTSGARNLEGLFTQLTDRGDEESRLASILQGLR